MQPRGEAVARPTAPGPGASPAPGGSLCGEWLYKYFPGRKDPYVKHARCGLRARWMLDGEPLCTIHLLVRSDNASYRSRPSKRRQDGLGGIDPGSRTDTPR